MQEHPVFRRKGADLVIEKSLTLTESLCGFDFSITHMDKRTLRVKSNPGQVRGANTQGGGGGFTHVNACRSR